MSDYISRADAIDAVAEEWLSEASAESPYVNDDDMDRYRELAEELFADIPSADAEQGFRGGKIPPKEMLDGTVLIPKHQWLEMERELAELKEKFESADAVHGEWLEIEDYNGDYHYQCSVCKDEFYLEYGTPKENGYAYCPSCGARMYKGGDDE